MSRTAPDTAEGTAALYAEADLVKRARRRQVLVEYTMIAFPQVALSTAAWVRKVPSLRVLVPGGHWTKTDPDSGRLDAEPAVPKIGASASIGTWLGSLLATHGVDTVLVAARRRQDASDRGRRSAGELRHLRARGLPRRPGASTARATCSTWRPGTPTCSPATKSPTSLLEAPPPVPTSGPPGGGCPA